MTVDFEKKIRSSKILPFFYATRKKKVVISLNLTQFESNAKILKLSVTRDPQSPRLSDVENIYSTSTKIKMWKKYYRKIMVQIEYDCLTVTNTDEILCELRMQGIRLSNEKCLYNHQ